MERLCEALDPLLGPHISVEAHGSAWISVQLDQGSGGSMLFRAAPWFPSLTVRRHLLQTARNVAERVHGSVSDEDWADLAGIGPTSPSVAVARDIVTIRFFGSNGEPLPAVEVSLVDQRR